MAGCEGVDFSNTKLKEKAKESSSGSPTPECAICLQSCVHPVCLPCAHVFCFLCVKGASWQGKRCALCRQEIPEDFLERPVLLSPEDLKAAAAGLGGSESRGVYAWYYEGHNGWWQYDGRTSGELEDAFLKNKKSMEMLIAGFLYVADLENMVQYRRNEHGRRRKIKRDVMNIPKKGVAGLRLEPPSIPNLTSATVERISSADGSDTAGQPQSSSVGIAASVTPVRPQTLLGRHLISPTASSSLEQAFSQLLIGQPEGEEVEGDDDSQAYEIASGSSESEDEGGVDLAARRRRGHCPLRESQPTRIPPRGGPPSSAVVPRSRSPDGSAV